MPLNLYCLYVPKIDESVLQHLVCKLPQNVLDKILSYRMIKDQWRAALSNIFVRKMLAQELGLNLESIEIKVGNYGKPYLEGERRHFNLSHTDDIIILATDDFSVGVDVEYVYPLTDFEYVLEYFSETERKACLTIDKQQRLKYFYKLWTLKESYIKALGKGLSYPLDSFSINISEEEISITEISDISVNWYFKCYTLNPEYQCAVCIQHNHFPEQASIIDCSKILDLSF